MSADSKRTSPARRPAALLLAAAAALAWAVPAAAQDLTYTEVSKAEVGGAMGRMMSMAGGMEPTTTTTRIHGSWTRVDSEGSSTLTNWETGEMIMLDHESRTYVRMSLEDMARMAGAGAQAMAGAEMPEESERPEVDVSTSVETRRTGEHRDIAGYDAERVILIMKLVGERTDEPEEEDAMTRAGMAAVTELWVSTEFPGYRIMQERGRQMAGSLREGMMGGGLAALDPRMSEAMKKNAEAWREVEGTPLRTVMSMVTLPGEADLDVDAVLASLDEPLDQGPGMGGMAAAAAAEAAAAAARSRLGGLFGRGKKEEPKEEAPPEPRQSVMMRVVTEITDVDTSPVDPALFEIPEGYTERKMEMPVGPGR